MQLRLDDLDAHLAKTLAALYVVHGDEPLLSLEAADAIRAKARAAGHTEREVLQAERGFDWGALGAASSSMSLFGDRRIVELRIPSGKPGTDGAAAIQAYCARLPDDTLTIVSLPRLDKTGQNSAWFGALSAAGAVVNVYPIDRSRLPAWIAGQLARQKQRVAKEALDFIADSVEGNLLAAHQEIQKLGLLYPAGELSFDDVKEAVLDVARYDVYQLSEAMLAGDRVRLARILSSLEGEGEAPPRVLWVMSEEVRAAARLQRGLAAGRRAMDLFRELRIWNEGRQRLLERAAKRLAPEAVDAALDHCARVDRLAKGLGKADVWDELLQVGLRFA